MGWWEEGWTHRPSPFGYFAVTFAQHTVSAPKFQLAEFRGGLALRGMLFLAWVSSPCEYAIRNLDET